jgi:hypothetical protein
MDGDMGDDVVQTISTAVIDGSAGNANFPWNDGDLAGYLALVLPFAAIGREATVAETLIDGLAHAQARSKMAITCALLSVVVPSTDYRALSDLQRRALKAIDEHGQWQRKGGTLVNFGLRTRGHGLPSDRDDFRSFVQAAEASARGEATDWNPRARPPAPKRADPLVAGYFVVLFGVPLLIWLLLGVLDHFLLPSTPRGWGLLLFLVLGLGVSTFFLRRLSSARRPRIRIPH